MDLKLEKCFLTKKSELWKKALLGDTNPLGNIINWGICQRREGWVTSLAYCIHLHCSFILTPWTQGPGDKLTSASLDAFTSCQAALVRPIDYWDVGSSACTEKLKKRRGMGWWRASKILFSWQGVPSAKGPLWSYCPWCWQYPYRLRQDFFSYSGVIKESYTNLEQERKEATGGNKRDKKDKGPTYTGRTSVRFDGKGKGTGIWFSNVCKSSGTLKDNHAPFVMEGTYACCLCILLLYAYIPWEHTEE